MTTSPGDIMLFKFGQFYRLKCCLRLENFPLFNYCYISFSKSNISIISFVSTDFNRQSLVTEVLSVTINK